MTITVKATITEVTCTDCGAVLDAEVVGNDDCWSIIEVKPCSNCVNELLVGELLGLAAQAKGVDPSYYDTYLEDESGGLVR